HLRLTIRTTSISDSTIRLLLRYSSKARGLAEPGVAASVDLAEAVAAAGGAAVAEATSILVCRFVRGTAYSTIPFQRSAVRTIQRASTLPSATCVESDA